MPFQQAPRPSNRRSRGTPRKTPPTEVGGVQGRTTCLTASSVATSGVGAGAVTRRAFGRLKACPVAIHVQRVRRRPAPAARASFKVSSRRTRRTGLPEDVRDPTQRAVPRSDLFIGRFARELSGLVSACAIGRRRMADFEGARPRAVLVQGRTMSTDADLGPLMLATIRITDSCTLSTRRPEARGRTHARGSPARALCAALAGGLAGLALGAMGAIAAPTVDVAGAGAETPFASAHVDRAERSSDDPSRAIADVLVPAGAAAVIVPAAAKAKRP